MKKITFLLLFFTISLISGQVMVNDFETGSAAVEALFGATATVVANPDSNPGSGNTTANCLQVGRTSTNWYELIRINVDPDLAISSSENKYLSVMVYNITTDIVVRFDANADDNNGSNNGLIRPDVLHSGFNEWQQIIIPIKDTPASANFTTGTLFNIIFHADAGGAQVPGGFQLNNSTSYLYIDQIQILDSNPLSTTSFELEKNISLFPNPAENVFTLETSGNVIISNVSVFNMLGQKKTVKPSALNKNEYDISALTSGLYLVKISDTNGKSITKRIIKK